MDREDLDQQLKEHGEAMQKEITGSRKGRMKLFAAALALLVIGSGRLLLRRVPGDPEEGRRFFLVPGTAGGGEEAAGAAGHPQYSDRAGGERGRAGGRRHHDQGI